MGGEPSTPWAPRDTGNKGEDSEGRQVSWGCSVGFLSSGGQLHHYLDIRLKNKVIENEGRIRRGDMPSSTEVQGSLWLHSGLFGYTSPEE